MKDTILIKRLKVPTFIGVPDEERAEIQELRISLELVPVNDFRNLGDDIAQTVNYYEVAQRVKAVAMEKPRKLIETLAEELCEMVLGEFAVAQVLVEIEKFILPDADWVGLRLKREKCS